MSEPHYNPEPDDDTPTQEEFIRRLAAFPHSRDSNKIKRFELEPLRYLNDIVVGSIPKNPNVKCLLPLRA